MGLDSVELVMAFEERFGVTITDAEAEACFTPAAVIDLVFGKLRAGDAKVCVTQRAFHLLRNGLVQTLAVPRREVRLTSDVRCHAEGRCEREVWDELKSAIQAKRWPGLVRPTWLVACLWILPMATFGAFMTVSHWATATACAVLAGWSAIRITRPFRSRIPTRFAQLRNLVPYAMTSEAMVWTRDQVACLVKKLVVDQLCLEQGRYREDAHFVRDLGLE